MYTELGLASPMPTDIFQNRANELAQEVRCPVCLGQSIGESDTKESLALKGFILDHLHQGLSEHDIRKKLRTLYGDDILFRPPFSWDTLFLWSAPFVLCLAIFWVFIYRMLIRRR
jgi:cytochrome c-type biogenesis protein CcmH